MSEKPNDSRTGGGAGNLTIGEVSTGRLFDYTRFHVGLYSSLVFGVVALIGIGSGAAPECTCTVGGGGTRP